MDKAEEDTREPKLECPLRYLLRSFRSQGNKFDAIGL